MAKRGSTVVTSPTSGKQYKAGDTVKGKSGKEYKVQSDGTMTCDGKSYVFTDSGIKQQSSTSGKNGSGGTKGGSSGSSGGTKGGSSGSSGTRGGSTGSSGSSGSSGTTGSSIAQDLKTIQNLGGCNSTEIYKNAKAQGLSTEEANRLASTFGRLNSAAGADSSTLYQYGVTQSDVNNFNIVRGNNIANAAISTGTYTFNTKTYANVTKELATSADASKTMVSNIDRAISNTDKSSDEYKQLVDMRERMYQVNQSTDFVRNRLEDAYNATKAADNSVQRIVMNVQTDSLQITVGKTLAYDSANSAISREGDSRKWSNYVTTGIVGSGGTNNSTVQSLQEVNQLEGTNLNTVSDIFSAYDRSRNLESCTSMRDKAVYARNNENGLQQVAEFYKEQGFSEEHWKKFLDTYYTTDKNGNKKESTVSEDVYMGAVDYYNNLSIETKVATVEDYKAASNDTNEVLSRQNSGCLFGDGITQEDFKYVHTFAKGSYPQSIGNTTINGVSDAKSEEAYQKYLYNLCKEQNYDYPMLLAMLFYENGGYVTDRGNGQGCFGFTGGGSNCSSYSTSNYAVTDANVQAARDKALMDTFGTTDVGKTGYGSLYYGAAYAIEVMNSKVSERGAYDGLASYCGAYGSADKRISLANQIRQDLGWSQVDYYKEMC